MPVPVGRTPTQPNRTRLRGQCDSSAGWARPTSFRGKGFPAQRHRNGLVQEGRRRGGGGAGEGGQDEGGGGVAQMLQWMDHPLRRCLARSVLRATPDPPPRAPRRQRVRSGGDDASSSAPTVRFPVEVASNPLPCGTFASSINSRSACLQRLGRVMHRPRCSSGGLLRRC